MVASGSEIGNAPLSACAGSGCAKQGGYMYRALCDDKRGYVYVCVLVRACICVCLYLCLCLYLCVFMRVS